MTRHIHLILVLIAALLALILGLSPLVRTAKAQVVMQPTTGQANALVGVTCGSAASSCVLKSGSGNLYGVYVQCTSACWFMIFNTLSLPANGSTTAGTDSGNLVECVDVAANTGKSLTYPTFPRYYSVGILVAISSTACVTLTASTVGFISGTAK